jgi:hypothetical protein
MIRLSATYVQSLRQDNKNTLPEIGHSKEHCMGNKTCCILGKMGMKHFTYSNISLKEEEYFSSPFTSTTNTHF